METDAAAALDLEVNGRTHRLPVGSTVADLL